MDENIGSRFSKGSPQMPKLELIKKFELRNTNDRRCRNANTSNENARSQSEMLDEDVSPPSLQRSFVSDDEGGGRECMIDPDNCSSSNITKMVDEYPVIKDGGIEEVKTLINIDVTPIREESFCINLYEGSGQKSIESVNKQRRGQKQQSVRFTCPDCGTSYHTIYGLRRHFMKVHFKNWEVYCKANAEEKQQILASMEEASEKWRCIWKENKMARSCGSEQNVQKNQKKIAFNDVFEKEKSCNIVAVEQPKVSCFENFENQHKSSEGNQISRIVSNSRAPRLARIDAELKIKEGIFQDFGMDWIKSQNVGTKDINCTPPAGPLKNGIRDVKYEDEGAKRSFKNRNVAGTPPITCLICKVNFAHKKYLRRHMVRKHSITSKPNDKRGNISDKKISKVVNPGKLKKSKNNSVSKNKPFQCRKFPTKLTQRYKLVQHKRQHSSSPMKNSSATPQIKLVSNNAQPKSFPCEVCGKTYIKEYNLNQHTTKQHRKNIGISEIALSLIGSKNSEKPGPTKIGSKAFTVKKTLTVDQKPVKRVPAMKKAEKDAKHKSKLDTVKAENNEQSFMEAVDNPSCDSVGSPEKIFSCRICGLKLATLLGLRTHKRGHFKCGKRLTTPVWNLPESQVKDDAEETVCSNEAKEFVVKQETLDSNECEEWKEKHESANSKEEIQESSNLNETKELEVKQKTVNSNESEELDERQETETSNEVEEVEVKQVKATSNEVKELEDTQETVTSNEAQQEIQETSNLNQIKELEEKQETGTSNESKELKERLETASINAVEKQETDDLNEAKELEEKQETENSQPRKLENTEKIVLLSENQRPLRNRGSSINEISSHDNNVEFKAITASETENQNSTIPQISYNQNSIKHSFECPICKKSYSWRGNLNRHMRLHHSGSKNKGKDRKNSHSESSFEEHASFHATVEAEVDDSDAEKGFTNEGAARLAHDSEGSRSALTVETQLNISSGIKIKEEVGSEDEIKESQHSHLNRYEILSSSQRNNEPRKEGTISVIHPDTDEIVEIEKALLLHFIRPFMESSLLQNEKVETSENGGIDLVTLHTQLQGLRFQNGRQNIGSNVDVKTLSNGRLKRIRRESALERRSVFKKRSKIPKLINKKDLLIGKTEAKLENSNLAKEYVVGHNSDDSVPLIEMESFPCLLCGKLFTKDDLSVHIKTHTSDSKKVHQCNQCMKVFTREDNLRRHLLLHSEERHYYKCSKCDKSFSRAHSLKIHELSHVGSKVISYKCMYCDLRFLRRYSRIRHIKQHHLDDELAETGE